MGLLTDLIFLKAGDNDNISYTKHSSKLRKSYRFLKPEAESDEVNVYIEAGGSAIWQIRPDSLCKGCKTAEADHRASGKMLLKIPGFIRVSK